MARLGVTYQDIANAANQLLGQGKSPTIELIRQFLGTGSSTTIANHLRVWRREQDGSFSLSRKEDLPQEMVTMMKGLWERLAQQAEEKVTMHEEAHQVVLTEVQQTLQKYKTNNHRWQQLFHQWLVEKEQLTATITSLQQDKVYLTTQLSAQTEQLQEKRLRVEELHRLHTKVQANLEHYRESMKEQRENDQLQFTQQKNALQAEILLTREQVENLRMQTVKQQQTLQEKQQEYTKMQAIIGQQQQQMTMLEKANHAWQKRCDELQATLTARINQLTAIQVEMKTVSTQLTKSQHVIAELQTQYKQVLQEKWQLGQEKAQLEGVNQQLKESYVIKETL